MTTYVCPPHIGRMFRSGKAPEAVKKKARAMALAWMKQQLPKLKPGDVVMAPNPRDGEYEEFTKTDEAMVN